MGTKARRGNTEASQSRWLQLMARRLPPEAPSETRPSELRELRGRGGIRPDYDYKSLRSGKAPA